MSSSSDGLNYLAHITGRQIRDTVLAKEGEGREARGDSCQDGHEGERTACIVERWTECVQETAAKLRSGLCLSEWRFRPCLLNSNLVGQQQVSMTSCWTFCPCSAAAFRTIDRRTLSLRSVHATVWYYAPVYSIIISLVLPHLLRWFCCLPGIRVFGIAHS